MTRRELLWGAAGFAATGLALRLAAAHAAEGSRVHRITMRNMRFGPVPAGIKLGDAVMWVNDDIVPHTATARNGAFDIGLPAHASRRMNVTRAGAFDFYCRYHPAMRGRLTIAG